LGVAIEPLTGRMKIESNLAMTLALDDRVATHQHDAQPFEVAQRQGLVGPAIYLLNFKNTRSAIVLTPGFGDRGTKRCAF
jgi:hypothetical protein